MRVFLLQLWIVFWIEQILDLQPVAPLSDSLSDLNKTLTATVDPSDETSCYRLMGLNRRGCEVFGKKYFLFTESAPAIKAFKHDVCFSLNLSYFLRQFPLWMHQKETCSLVSLENRKVQTLQTVENLQPAVLEEKPSHNYSKKNSNFPKPLLVVVLKRFPDVSPRRVYFCRING